MKRYIVGNISGTFPEPSIYYALAFIRYKNEDGEIVEDYYLDLFQAFKYVEENFDEPEYWEEMDEGEWQTPDYEVFVRDDNDNWVLAEKDGFYENDWENPDEWYDDDWLIENYGACDPGDVSQNLIWERAELNEEGKIKHE